MSLQGARELRARLKALRLAFKPAGREWGNETVRLARQAVARNRRTGRLDRSFRVRNASQRKATVVAHYTANFIDAGTREHEIKPRKASVLRFQVGNRTVFAKKVRHPRVGARPFRARVAREALERTPMAKAVVDAWNKAA